MDSLDLMNTLNDCKTDINKFRDTFIKYEGSYLEVVTKTIWGILFGGFDKNIVIITQTEDLNDVVYNIIIKELKSIGELFNCVFNVTEVGEYRIEFNNGNTLLIYSKKAEIVKELCGLNINYLFDIKHLSLETIFEKEADEILVEQILPTVTSQEVGIYKKFFL